MEKIISDYILHKRLAWSPTTLRNAGITLKAYGNLILAGDAMALYLHLEVQGKRASTIGTIFTLAAGLYSHINDGRDPFTRFRKDNRNAFKNKTVPKVIEKSYKEVKDAIEGAKDCWQKETALKALGGALRSCEVGCGRYGFISSSNDHQLRGKGGKLRLNLSKASGVQPGGVGSYHSFYKWVTRTCGVPPHALRKLALSRAVDNGATAADLCAIAGWSSIATAYVYLQPKDASRLTALLR